MPSRSLPRRGTTLARLAPAAAAQREPRLDVRQVRERLGKIAEHLSGVGVVLLGEEAEPVGGRHRPVECLARLLRAALMGEGGRQPERTGKKGALAALEAVVGRVAAEEPVPAELFAD